MQVKVIKSGLLQTNTYIISINNSCIIIDPAFASNNIGEYVASQNFKVLGILLTHGHFDHIADAEDLAKMFDCKIYIGHEDLAMVTDAKLNGSSKYLKKEIQIDKKYITLFNKEIILKLDNFMIDVMFTPGHSRGSCCYLIGNELFSGDTLFRDGVGRVDLPEGNSKDMQYSLKKLFTLNNDVVVFPGHGDDTTIGKEKSRYM